MSHNMDHMETDLPDPQYQNSQHQTKKTRNRGPPLENTLFTATPTPAANFDPKSGDSSSPPQNQVMTSSQCPESKQTESGDNPDQDPTSLPLLENSQDPTGKNSHADLSTHESLTPADDPSPVTTSDEHSENITMDLDPRQDRLSIDTILDDLPTQKSYSQALTGDTGPRRTRNPELTNLIDKWTGQFRLELAETKTDLFDATHWTRDKIIAAYDNPIDMRNLIEHKMKTRLTLEIIPKAIRLKFQHKDRAFFRTFTRRHDTRPCHQLEFQTLLNDAIEKYKKRHNAHLINKENKDQISDMLRKKLAIDFWTNLNFTTLDAYEIARYTLYIAGFAKIKTTIDFDTIRAMVTEAHSKSLTNLPESPENIPRQIQCMLPFTLPLTNRKHVRAVAITLRQIYIFERLPEAYIADHREPLPEHPEWLNEETRKLFPVKSRSDLKKVYGYKQQLQQYYIFSKLPDTYFDLPPKKIALPLTPQELTPCFRGQFPFFPIDSDHFKEQVNKLRTVYAFERLPNDYLISKKRLPADPKDLTLATQFTFPISDKDAYQQFIQMLPRYYAIPEPLPQTYVNFNYTNKPALPTDPELVTKTNLTLPIATPKELVIAARALREHYFFWAIPKDWIQIPDKETNTNDNGFPKTIEQLNEQIQQRNLPTKWKFPVERQEEFPEAADFLRRTFLVENIPEFVFKIESFPPPNWDLFNDDDNLDTTMTEQPIIADVEQETAEPVISHEHSQ